MRLATVVGRILVSHLALFLVRREGLQANVAKLLEFVADHSRYIWEQLAGELVLTPSRLR
jgi:hypothetical protein